MRSDFDGNEVSVQAHVRESQCIKSLGKELDAFAVDLQSLLDKLLILQGSQSRNLRKIIHVERMTNAVQHGKQSRLSDTVTDASTCQTVSLGESACDHHIRVQTNDFH